MQDIKTALNVTRCYLDAIAMEARRYGCRFDWVLDPIADGTLNPDYYPAGQHYFSLDLTASGCNFYAGDCGIIPANELDRALDRARTLRDSFMQHIARVRANGQQLQATFNF